jgi:hypothetical protein
MIPQFLANYNKNWPFWYVKAPLLASVSPTIPLLTTTIVVKTVVITIKLSAITRAVLTLKVDTWQQMHYTYGKC